MINTHPSTGGTAAIDKPYASRALSAAGYVCWTKGDLILVSDPEQSSIKGTVYRTVALHNNSDLARFLSERS